MAEQKEEKKTGKKKIEPVTEKRGILYEVVRVLAKIVFHTVMPVRFHNKERLRQEPPLGPGALKFGLKSLP